MNIYLTGDLHLNHQRVMDYIGIRNDFKNIKEMNNTLIERINNVVTNDDQLYHLGDFGLYIYKDEMKQVLKKINGQIHLIMGNHDVSYIFKEIANEPDMILPNGKKKIVVHNVGVQISYKGICYILTHYPMDLLTTGTRFRNFCSHLHDKVAQHKDVLNVGVDSPELPRTRPFGEPIKFEEAAKLLQEKMDKYGEKEYETFLKSKNGYEYRSHYWASDDEYPILL